MLRGCWLASWSEIRFGWTQSIQPNGAKTMAAVHLFVVDSSRPCSALRLVAPSRLETQQARSKQSEDLISRYGHKARSRIGSVAPDDPKCLGAPKQKPLQTRGMNDGRLILLPSGYVGAACILAAARCDNGLGARAQTQDERTGDGMCDRSTVCCAHTLFPPPHGSARMSGSVKAWLPGADHQYCGSSFRSSPK